MKSRFNITYEIVTPESAERGDSAYRGYLPKSMNVPRRQHNPHNPARFTLREAFDLIANGSQPCEADSCPVTVPRWIQSSIDDYGESVTLAMHLSSADISPSSANRIARLFRVYGLKSMV
jgi:hypothetical protein